MTTTDAELLALAEKALLPEPERTLDTSDQRMTEWTIGCGRFNAAANPARIKALLEEKAALEKRVAPLASCLVAADALRERAETAEAALATELEEKAAPDCSFD